MPRHETKGSETKPLPRDGFWGAKAAGDTLGRSARRSRIASPYARLPFRWRREPGALRFPVCRPTHCRWTRGVWRWRPSRGSADLSLTRRARFPTPQQSVPHGPRPVLPRHLALPRARCVRIAGRNAARRAVNRANPLQSWSPDPDLPSERDLAEQFDPPHRPTASAVGARRGAHADNACPDSLDDTPSTDPNATTNLYDPLSFSARAAFYARLANSDSVRKILARDTGNPRASITAVPVVDQTSSRDDPLPFINIIGSATSGAAARATRKGRERTRSAPS